MARRQKEWAKRARIELLILLGGTCFKCGTEDMLEFDCIQPQGHRHHTFDTSQRMSFYRAQYKKGNLQILCERCHNKKASKEQLCEINNGDSPF